MSIKKIVVLGPESTGKSTLCAQLAAHYDTLWVPEYAREYLSLHGMDYTYEDLLLIAKGQIELEEKVLCSGQWAVGSGQGAESSGQKPESRRQKAESSKQLPMDSGQKAVDNEKPATNIVHQTSHIVHRTSHIPHLFIDTDMYVMKVWCEFVFNKCHTWILNQIATRQYDAYLLCGTNLPWVKDKLREYPDEQTREKLYHFYRDIMVNQSKPWCSISGNYEERLLKAINFIGHLK